MSQASDYARTRRCLHGLAELVLAGPRFRTQGDIRLQVLHPGIGTVTEPVVSLVGGVLLTEDAKVELAGLTIAEAAHRAGLEPSALDDVYSGGPGVRPDEPVTLDPDSVRLVEASLAVGDLALREFAPDAERTLWPEHFDVAITVAAVNYGVSPGDDWSERPYAYVGPHEPRSGEFWNAPFGASRPMAELRSVDEVVAFFREGERLGH